MKFSLETCETLRFYSIKIVFFFPPTLHQVWLKEEDYLLCIICFL